MLSQFWLAALKDKAYLFLPAEFASQLPPSGGTFYSADVMESVRPYYQSNWSSLLHAAAIWLQERGFREMQEAGKQRQQGGGRGGGGGGESNGGLPVPLLGGGSAVATISSSSSSSFPSDPRVTNFNLVLGLAVQCLCSPATLDHAHVLSNCLRALQRLLSSSPGAACDVLRVDSRISVEILSVLHRLLLTAQAPPTHVLVLRIAILVGHVLREAIQTNSDESKDSSPPPPPLSTTSSATEHPPSSPPPPPMGSEFRVCLETSVEPGESCTYALLEVVSCCLLRLVPSLKQHSGTQACPSIPPSSSSTSLSSGPSHLAPSEEELTAILLCVKILATSCGLCAPEATPTALLTVLHLLLSTLSYVSMLPDHALSKVPQLPAAALQSLSQLCADLPVSHDKVGAQLGGILRSALTSVLGGYVSPKGQGSSSGGGQSAFEMSTESRLVIMAILLHGAGSRNVCPVGSQLFEGCVSLLEKSLDSKDTKVCGGGVCV